MKCSRSVCCPSAWRDLCPGRVGYVATRPAQLGLQLRSAMWKALCFAPLVEIWGCGVDAPTSIPPWGGREVRESTEIYCDRKNAL